MDKATLMQPSKEMKLMQPSKEMKLMLALGLYG
jgi:hypothetical protein